MSKEIPRGYHPDQMKAEALKTADRYLAILKKRLETLDNVILREPNEKRSAALKVHRDKLKKSITSIHDQKNTRVVGSKQLYGVYEKAEEVWKQVEADLGTTALPFEVIKGGKSDKPPTKQEQKKSA